MALQQQQLESIAVNAFRANVGIQYVYVADDGKVFLPMEKHFADLYAKENGIKVTKVEKK